MAVDVIMPQMGESIFEGTITKWLKKPGDRIERDEPLFEISTDKVDAEIPAPSAGVLKEIKVPEGQTVPIQTVVAVIEAAGAAAAAPAAAPRAASSGGEARSAQGGGPCAACPASTPPLLPQPPVPRLGSRLLHPPVRGNGQKIRSSPLVRRMAKEHNVDLAEVEGSGAGGRVSKKRYSGRGRNPAARSLRPPAAASPLRALRPLAAASRRLPQPPGPGGAVVHPALENAVPRERIYFGNLRSAAHEHDAPAHRRAHGGFQARVAACVFDRRSRHDAHRQDSRAFESRVRNQVRHQADLHALLRARLRRSAARVSHGQRFGRRNDRGAAPRNQRGHRRGAGMGPDRSGAQECRGEKFPGPGARHQRSGRARPRQETEARRSAGEHVLHHQSRASTAA